MFGLGARVCCELINLIMKIFDGKLFYFEGLRWIECFEVMINFLMKDFSNF